MGVNSSYTSLHPITFISIKNLILSFLNYIILKYKISYDFFNLNKTFKLYNLKVIFGFLIIWSRNNFFLKKILRIIQFELTSIIVVIFSIIIVIFFNYVCYKSFLTWIIKSKKWILDYEIQKSLFFRVCNPKVNKKFWIVDSKITILKFLCLWGCIRNVCKCSKNLSIMTRPEPTLHFSFFFQIFHHVPPYKY